MFIRLIRIKQVNQIVRCALLAAVGDAKLSEEESIELKQVREYIDRFLDCKKAIEYYEEHGDFTKAVVMTPELPPNGGSGAILQLTRF